VGGEAGGPRTFLNHFHQGGIMGAKADSKRGDNYRYKTERNAKMEDGAEEKWRRAGGSSS